ncbi:orotidine-5'-phosphate decarboxylase [Lysinibacillus sphaericus]|uniref:Orotidine 5'-phosphate decarboxylase n=1 Tax=Lysinibacillus tabacifolii TaxID=1173107 RepID=A0ABY2SZB7_9BACI|nr:MULTISPECIES: orotidine-5'-phosphate decarboxylase [Lysinibacillus]MCS1382146.1 orotidine-5'-phosphate decarboxylase [Lysinibacillus sphaericus]TKI47597.1 orotidine-5'-phosphate decarboxylase [Lysinibacillus tabacifolii]UDK96608.1 orotidine-5'-phosphate decarboxylase [Lysinibacillus sphaericus]
MNNIQFADRICAAIKQKKSHAVVGLDPVITRIPTIILDEAEEKYGKNENGAAFALLEFNKLIIDAISEDVAIVKPQLAYYEEYGAPGIEAFWRTVEYSQQKGLIVIADAKRGDIDTTATAYATSFFGNLKNEWKTPKKVDSLTINPYLGSDSLEPFVQQAIEKHTGLFILVKTSNPSSGELQELLTENGTIAENVATLVQKYGQRDIGTYGYSSVGAVVGATYPEAQAIYRKKMPQSLFLVPGYGTQGGNGKDITNAFNADGFGALISASRSIIFAYEKANAQSKQAIQETTRIAIQEMNMDINTALKNVGKLNW